MSTQNRLSETDRRHLQEAEGLITLGMYLEAHSALEEVTPPVRHVPEVLLLRLKIFKALKKWDPMCAVAMRLLTLFPESVPFTIAVAEATYGERKIDAGIAWLHRNAELSPENPKTFYTLACLEAANRQTFLATLWLKHAFRLKPELRITALDDPELDPVWDLISER